ncbi:MAG: LysR family transcriptional regulator [Oscillospiraceae bacterium]|nr:LysR family transcriptional regulator [Oscillospiraceae bacterium]
MELQQLKYFKTVAAIGKISDAAEALFISAPALSTSISRLEKELGMKLFDRTSNRITLNAQGQILLKYVNQVFANLESAKQELHQSMLHQGPHISLVSINSLMWVNLIASFTAEFSKYTLSCSGTSISELAENGFSSQHNFLLAHECDIPPAYEDKLDSIFLFQAIPTVMLHKDHPLAQKDVLDIRELMNERIFLPMPSASMYVRLQQLFELHNLPFPTDNFNSFQVRQRMVTQNQGVSFFSQHPGYMALPNIRYIPLIDPFGPWNARLYWRKDRPLSDEEKAFRDFATEFYRDLH